MNKGRIILLIICMPLFGGAFVAERNGLLSFRIPETTLQVAPNIAQQPLSEIEESISKEVSDLLTVVYALDRYKEDHGSYPISSSGGNGWDGIISAYGESREDWIQGLVPEYLDSLPRDPRMLDDGTRQYIYRSNGANYKLIVHKTDNCELIKGSYPSLVDPKRKCFAFGFWTKRASRW